MSSPPDPGVPNVGKLVNVIPVGLKEAALDSPTFRAITVHFADQIDFVEKWLDSYIKATVKLSAEVTSLETLSNAFLAQVAAPIGVSEAVLDHDYALLAMKRYGESAKDLWHGVVSNLKKTDVLIAEPIRAFIQGDLRSFKETRRNLDQTQKQYDHLQARYSSQAKSKEPSSLREDAFQLHEARKAYLKASMDFCVQSAQVKAALDKLLVNVSFDQWRELKIMRDSSAATIGKWGHEMDRIKGWTHEMEISEKVLRKDLLNARKQIEEAAEVAIRPSRELDDYSISTVPFLGAHGAAALKVGKDQVFGPEKQGWLFLRTLSGKPTRTFWIRRWAFLRNGIFGCLVHGSRTGGVEESERIGVLLCSIRPAFQEERRFCFEVKTKNNTIMLQAESQSELTEWIGSFEAAKRKALENPSPDLAAPGQPPAKDPAFAISQPPAPEFTADLSDSFTPNANEEPSDRTNTLPPDRDSLGIRNSGDFTAIRRSTMIDRDNEGPRDPASRIMQRLDLHRKSPSALHPPSPSPIQPLGFSGLLSPGPTSSPLSATLPPNGTESDALQGKNTSSGVSKDVLASTLAPLTLANPPAPTSMSRAAVIISNERGIVPDGAGGIPSGIMANLWGSTNWSLMNRLGIVERSTPVEDTESEVCACHVTNTPSTTKPPVSRHRQTLSLGADGSVPNSSHSVSYEYPCFFPPQLKPQDAQFRLLFPKVPREETLVLVFRATFSPNDYQDFPGRAYVTTRNLYFYSNHFGLVLTSCASFDRISEVTAAPGRDCDFLFLHVLPEKGSETPGRLTVKTFLEPLRLLQRRLNYLITAANSEDPPTLESIFKSLVKMEMEAPQSPLSVDSWEDVSLSTPADNGNVPNGANSKGFQRSIKAGVYIDKDFHLDHKRAGRRTEAPRFKLPSKPVNYVPQGVLHLAAERIFDISPKALFHVLFGDKSDVWQLLQCQRRARNINQGPWTHTQSSHMRRDFNYKIEAPDFFGRARNTEVSDYQIVDVLNEHLCYVVTDKRTPWHLPFKRYFRLVSKIVITHVSKSRCKLAVFTKVEWLWEPYVIRRAIDKQAMNDLEQDALDLIDLVSDQVKRIGHHSQTKRAITMFGYVGRDTEGTQFTGVAPILKSQLRRPLNQRSLFHLLVETSASFLQSAVSSLMMWLWALLRWTWKTSSAHSVILFLLLSSLLVNAFFSYHDTRNWWHERNAGNFMARLGVGPNNVMSKAIYIRDLDAAIANATEIQSHNSSTCFSLFRENHALSSADEPWALSVSSSPGGARSKGTMPRFKRTRQRLGTYRHDLLVALRMVNSIEREVLRSEWERWLRQETHRCHMVGSMLRNAKHDINNDSAADNAAGGARGGRLSGNNNEDIERWYNDYCLSCEREQENLKDQRAVG
ncbi:hypothetical protein AJ80_07761 [Polytolypa hystricis UAMH7299]|uniref:Transcription factor SipA3 n=1 Tax=Polytolypa hystricis (strain UAMH7299) TaxID=1447883 RepID=A0A2B7XAX9_POLH7|nr:hypothetical protein AJ80_07761 [Polytolypa hystricis UAMH7299]